MTASSSSAKKAGSSGPEPIAIAPTEPDRIDGTMLLAGEGDVLDWHS
jgi:hypothetical protein